MNVGGEGGQVLELAFELLEFFRSLAKRPDGFDSC
jgi:hypothetical protein